MSQTKAQLIQPIGVVTAGGVVVTGVVTASSFTGDVVGSATSIISGGNLNLGDVNATTFSGDFTGTATGINTGADIKVGQFTASSFTGDFTGTATSMFRGTGFKAGAVNATGFHVSGTSNGNITGNVTGNIVGDVDGNVTGNITGNVTGVSTGNVTGNVTGNLTGNLTGVAGSVSSGGNIHIGVITATSYSGDGQYLTGIAATNYNTQTVSSVETFSIDVGNSGSSAYTLSGTDRNGSVSGNNAGVSVSVGDTLNFVVDASGHPFYIRVSDGGANVSTPAATNQGAQSGTVSWTPNTAGTYYYQCGNHSGMIGTITVTASATTTIDLSAGNMITFNQSSDTTVAFANTETAMDITIIRNKDDNTTARTITWPDSIKWNGGTAPTLISKSVPGDSQQFQLITRDSGLTWYGWEPYKRDVVTFTAFGWATASAGSLGLNDQVNRSSPVQVGAAGNWKQVAASGTNRSALIDKSDNLWVMGDNQYGGLGQNQPNASNASSPIQIPGSWSVVTQGSMGAGGVKTDGSLWVWGRNDLGQLGQNDGVSRSSPVQMSGTTWSGNINHVDQTSNTDRLAIKTDGSLWMWGRNDEGVAGQNNRTQYSSPVQVGTDTTWQIATFGGMGGGNCFAIKTDGTLWSWGYESFGYLGHNQTTSKSSPTQVGTDTNWADVGGGDYASCATKTDGTLWTWGSNAFGELGGNFSGNGSMSTNSRSSPIQIPGTTWLRPWSGRHMMGCIKTDGTWWGWGSNYYGGLGLNESGSSSRFSSPVQLPGTWATDRKTVVARKHNGAWSMKE